MGGVCVLACGAGLVRLLPWLSSPEVPLTVVMPFARALGAVAIETALIIGLPIGFGLAAAVLTDRGELRAMSALGASPLDVVRSGWWVAASIVVVAAAAMLAVDPGANVPGRLATALIEQGRRSCAKAKTPRIARVPMTGLTWLCSPGREPIVAGPVPGARGRLWWAAHNVSASDDLSRMTLERLELFSLPRGKVPSVRARVARARFSGMAAWGRPSGLPAALRAAVVSLTALVLAASTALGLFHSGVRSRAVAVSIGSVAAALSLWLLHRLDDHVVAVWIVPWAGFAPLALSRVRGLTELGYRHFSWKRWS